MERGPGYIEYDAINGVDQYNRRGPSRTWYKVWIVANPAIHGHPLIVHLRAKFSAVVRNGTAAEDFAFLLADEETHRSTERIAIAISVTMIGSTGAHLRQTQLGCCSRRARRVTLWSRIAT